MGSSLSNAQVGTDTVGKTMRKTIDDVPMSGFLRKVAVFSSGGSFLDGYVLSLIGVALTQIRHEMELSTVWIALISSDVMVGILIGTTLGGYLTDIIGRRKMFIIDLVAIGLLSVLSALVQNPLELFLARALIGLFIGADYPIATSLIAEFTPKKHRSITMGCVSAAWYLGATAAAFVGFALYNNPAGWHWMLASGIVPAAILLIGRHDIPESPRWLAQRGRVEEAEEILHRVYGDDVVLEYEEPTEKVRISRVFKGGYGRRVVYVGVFILCQVVPMYAIYFYGPTIMEAFGLGTGRLAILGETVVSLFFLVGTVPAMFWANSMGRRKLIIGSLSLMAVGLLILGIFPAAPVIVVVFAFGLYAFFSGGPGFMQWLYPNELFPTEVRASAVGIAIGISRIGTIIGVYGTPFVMENAGVGATMLVAAGLVVFALVLSIFMAPETRGKTLVEASSLD